MHAGTALLRLTPFLPTGPSSKPHLCAPVWRSYALPHNPTLLLHLPPRHPRAHLFGEGHAPGKGHRPRHHDGAGGGAAQSRHHRRQHPSAGPTGAALRGLLGRARRWRCCVLCRMGSAASTALSCTPPGHRAPRPAGAGELPPRATPPAGARRRRPGGPTARASRVDGASGITCASPWARLCAKRVSAKDDRLGGMRRDHQPPRVQRDRWAVVPSGLPSPAGASHMSLLPHHLGHVEGGVCAGA